MEHGTRNPEPGTWNVANALLEIGDATSPALLHGSITVTYGELRERVAGRTARLRTAGAREGDRIGILAENGVFFVEAYLGTLQAGLVAVPIQTEASAETVRGILKEAGVHTIFVSRRQERKANGALEGLGVTVVLEAGSWKLEAGAGQVAGRRSQVGDQRSEVGGQRAETEASAKAGAGEAEFGGPFQVPSSKFQGTEASARREPETRNLEPGTPSAGAPPPALAALMYTSGSTGLPKGVMVTHQNVLANTRDIIETMGLTAADRVMVVLPFFYCYGLSLLHTHLAVGASLVINNQFLYPEQVLRDMVDKECTGLAGVPSTYQILLRKSRFKQMQFPALRWFQQAGGKLPNPYIQEIRETFQQVKFFTMYGQTEATARLSYLPPERLADKLGSIGKGLPSGRLEVLKEGSVPVTPGSDEVGEIVVSGDNITLGYWNDPEETARYFRNGKLHTGDLARVDRDGFIFIVEREREMIKSGGNRVGAKEVEEVIAELSDVVEVAVIGVPDEIMGEAIAAFVAPVRASTLTSEAIQGHCRRRLPSFKVPAQVRLMPQLPHNASGKVVKAALRARS